MDRDGKLRPSLKSALRKCVDSHRGANLVDPLDRMTRRTTGLLVLCASLIALRAFAQATVVMPHNAAARTGATLRAPIPTTTNVNVSEFRKLFERTVDYEIYVQPLYV